MDHILIEEIMKKAGRMLLYAGREKVIHSKPGEANFVTEYDIKTQNFLIEQIRKIVPDATFYGEEDTEYNTGYVADNGVTFIIDPIDGTTNFRFDYKHSNISIAIAENGEITHGLVYDPYLDEMYSAVRGEGAFLNGERMKIADRSIEEGIFGFGCARYCPENDALLWQILPELYRRSLAIRCCGAAAMDMCKVASGANVLYYHSNLQAYDYAAASLIITEAGGRIIRINKKTQDPNGPCSVIAGTPKACEQMYELCRSHI